LSAPAVPVTRPSLQGRHVSAVEELSLAELLDLFTPEFTPETRTAETAPAERPAGSHGTGLRARMQDWIQRAADWGSGPGGAWRAW
jgi:hypothetical protein